MKIQALKGMKIVLPTVEEFGDDLLVLSVDGTHTLWNEPGHPEFSQDKKAFSHKKKHAGLCYKLGIHLWESRLIWMNGSYYVGANNKANFLWPGGLKDTLVALDKKVLGNKAYNGYPTSAVCSMPMTIQQ